MSRASGNGNGGDDGRDRCGTCNFFEPNPDNPKAGECYGNPPTAFLVPAAPTVARPNAQGFGVVAVRPPVTARTLACGHYDDTLEGELVSPEGTA